MVANQACFSRKPRVQPSPQHLPVQGDVRQEPFMADFIKACFDIAFENPFGIVPMTQQVMSLSHRISTAAFPPKAIGMTIG